MLVILIIGNDVASKVSPLGLVVGTRSTVTKTSTPFLVLVLNADALQYLVHRRITLERCGAGDENSGAHVAAQDWSGVSW